MAEIFADSQGTASRCFSHNDVHVRLLLTGREGTSQGVWFFPPAQTTPSPPKPDLKVHMCDGGQEHGPPSFLELISYCLMFT